MGISMSKYYYNTARRKGVFHAGGGGMKLLTKLFRKRPPQHPKPLDIDKRYDWGRVVCKKSSYTSTDLDGIVITDKMVWCRFDGYLFQWER